MTSRRQKPKPSVCYSYKLLTVCLMKSIECTRCGSKEFLDNGGQIVCSYCQSRFMVEADDQPHKRTVIDVQSDIQSLLKKCIEDPVNRNRYASLILDIDPSNLEAIKYLT